MDAAIPATVEGQVFGIADRMNTIVDMFAIGLAPTGSKDPFALRRAANGVVKILAESELPLTLPEILQAAIANSTHAKTDAASVSSFLAERLEFYLREVKAQAYDVVKAVLAGGADDVRDAVARAEAVTAVRGSADFAAVCATFKRTVNLLQQTNEVERLGDLDAGLLVVPAEQRLYSHLNSIRPEWKNLVSSGRYIDALNLAAGLREDLDSFFNAVIVMIDDSSLRVNRIALLMRLIVSFRQIAEFSEIVT
jgi:glycyl-tRNA synthetase beta chain